MLAITGEENLELPDTHVPEAADPGDATRLAVDAGGQDSYLGFGGLVTGRGVVTHYRGSLPCIGWHAPNGGKVHAGLRSLQEADVREGWLVLPCVR